MSAISVKMPEDLKKWLTERAEGNYRSVTAEVNCLLQGIRKESEGGN